MFKNHIYKFIHIIGLLTAIVNIVLVSSDLKTLFIAESLPLKLLVKISGRFLIIFMALSLQGGVFDSSIAKIIHDDSRKFVSLPDLLTTRKAFLYKVFINWGGIFLIIGMFSFNWISYDMKLIYTQIIGITDLHIFLLCAFLLVFQKKIFKKEILLFLAISVFYITYSLNQGHGLLSTLQSFKDYFSVIWLYIFFKYFRFKNETITYYISFLKVIILLQLPVQLVQFMILRDPEFCSGTFGFHQTGVMGIFMTGVVLYFVSIKKLNFKKVLLIIYLSLSLLVGSSLFFFIINFFLVPIILIIKYKVKISSKILLVLILCLIFLGILNLNRLLKKGAESEAFNPFYYFSGEYIRDFFAIKGAYLNRGGAVLWTYYALKDEDKLFAGRGIGWSRSLSLEELKKFKILSITYDFPIIFLFCGISGLLVFFYLAYNLFKLRIRITSASSGLKIFILCLALLYVVGGIYSQGWISKTTGYCFVMLIGILSNKHNKKFFIEKYLKQDERNA